MFFPRFFRCFEESLGILWERLGRLFGNALGRLWGFLGRPWGVFGEALGGLGNALGAPWGGLGYALGRTSLDERFSLGETPWKTSLPRGDAKRLKVIFLWIIARNII